MDSDIQNLLDKSSKLSNNGKNVGELYNQIRKLKGSDPPPCFGDDDCSTIMLSMCPWRMDCGE